jgi:hypothetical protein
MIRRLTDEEHEKLWRICDGLLARSGAQAALLCDAETGDPLISVGDTSAAGDADEIRVLGRRERLVRGPAGQMYGIDIPGGALLAVLSAAGALAKLRKAAAAASRQAAAVLRADGEPKPPPKKRRRKPVSPRLRRRTKRRSTRT